MAELILTQEEKDAPNYIDWSDEALGKLVKKTALRVQDEEGMDSAFLITACKLLIDGALRKGSAESEFTLDGLTESNGDALGDWKIVVTREDIEDEDENDSELPVEEASLMKAIVEMPLSGECRLDMDKLDNIFNSHCLISRYKDDYQLIQVHSQSALKTLLKISISKQDALSIIEAHNLQMEKSGIFSCAESYRLPQ